MKTLLQYLCLISCVCVVTSSLLATPPQPDSELPVQITADHASFDHKLGVAVYLGNVKVNQGSRHLTANKLVIESDNNRIKIMIATGNPATFRSQQNPNKPAGTGSAKVIKYYPQKDKVDLLYQAQLTQDGDTISGPRLSYNFVTEVLQGNSSARERTTVIIQPKRAQ